MHFYKRSFTLLHVCITKLWQWMNKCKFGILIIDDYSLLRSKKKINKENWNNSANYRPTFSSTILWLIYYLLYYASAKWLNSKSNNMFSDPQITIKMRFSFVVRWTCIYLIYVRSKYILLYFFFAMSVFHRV